MQPWRKLLVLLALIALATAVHGAEDPATPGVADEGDVPEAVVGEEAVEVEAEAGEAMPAAEEEAAVDAVAEEAPARASAASVQWVVTQKMRSQLTKLGYGEEEIAQLDAERAAAIIRRNISRPQKGVPTGWNKGVRRTGSPIVGAGRSLLSAVGKSVGGMPGGPAVPVAALASVVGALTFGLKGGGITSAAVERVLAAPEELEVEVPISSDELWLDRQIDKFIAMLKRMLGK